MELLQKEIKKRDIIKRIKTDYPVDPSEKTPYNIDFGVVKESESYSTEREAFIDSELLKRREIAVAQEKMKIEELQQLLEISEEKAKVLYQQSLKSQDKERYLRPDLYLKRKKSEIDQLIREDIIPQLLVDFNLELSSNELTTNRFILPRKYQYIYKTAKNNGALLGIYFNHSLKNFIGDGREDWKLDDYDRAINNVYEIDSHLRAVMRKYFWGE